MIDLLIYVFWCASLALGAGILVFLIAAYALALAKEVWHFIVG